ncbi:hypothetical protein [Elioraea sp.]|uniref:hypothetical protein n=1 Tax=Elioraea sp. TaxID=2185103 RepID=UPI0025BDF590|nr:hypothetical protein [Elioraea sp.]
MAEDVLTTMTTPEKLHAQRRLTGPTSLSRVDVRSLFRWCLAAPALAAWPFLSAFPLFEMLSSEPSGWLITTRSILLATGFWAALGAYIAFRLARFPGAGEIKRDGGLAIGLYAAAWISAYMVIYLLPLAAR